MNRQLLKEQEVKAYLAGDTKTAGLCAELQELDDARDDAADLRAELVDVAEQRSKLRAKVAHLEATIELLKAEVRKLDKIRGVLAG